MEKEEDVPATPTAAFGRRTIAPPAMGGLRTQGVSRARPAPASNPARRRGADQGAAGRGAARMPGETVEGGRGTGDGERGSILSSERCGLALADVRPRTFSWQLPIVLCRSGPEEPGAAHFRQSIAHACFSILTGSRRRSSAALSRLPLILDPAFLI